MIKKILLVILCIQPIYSLELILKSGDAFICDAVEENDRIIKIRFKDKLYEIPKSEIQMRDNSKTGTHKGYTLASIAMLDGSTVKGNIAEESDTILTVQTILGYLSLDKAKIANVTKPDPKIEVTIPKDYLEQSYRLTPIRFGVNTYFASNGQPLSAISPTIYGGSVFFEPSNLSWRDTWNIGFKSEYLISSGEGSRYGFYNQIVYLQYRKSFSKWLDFYANIGFGGAYIRYRKDEAYIEGFQGLSATSFGYQGIKFGKLTLRIGPRVLQYFQKPYYHNVGFEIGIVYSL